MDMRTTDQMIPGQGDCRPASLRCPFCNTDGVEIQQVRERRPRTGGPEGSAGGPRSFEGAIYEFQAHCPKCKKKYRQTCPDNLLPKDFMPAD